MKPERKNHDPQTLLPNPGGDWVHRTVLFLHLVFISTRLRRPAVLATTNGYAHLNFFRRRFAAVFHDVPPLPGTGRNAPVNETQMGLSGCAPNRGPVVCSAVISVCARSAS